MLRTINLYFCINLLFHIITKVVGKKVFRMVLDEGALTSMLSLTCWKSLVSPELVTSPTTLKAFDGWDFQPHGLISTLTIELGEKTISIQVELVDAPLDYNLLLGRNWFYAMNVVLQQYFERSIPRISGELLLLTSLIFVCRMLLPLQLITSPC